MFTLYWGFVREAAAVWQWKRSRIDSGFFAPNWFFIIFAQTRRAARNFAISSKKSAWHTKKNASLGANLSTSIPVFVTSSTYVTAFAIVKAISCSGDDPASLV